MKKIRILIYLILITCHFSNAQNHPFENLSSLYLYNDSNYCIYFDTTKTEIINKSFKELNDSIAGLEWLESEYDIVAIKATISKTKMYDYFIVFSTAPSMDPCFNFYDASPPYKLQDCIFGEKLYITSNDYFYVSGSTNYRYEIKRKFSIESGSIKEVNQPFYYVGLETETLQPIKLFKTKEKKDIVASLPANYTIEVLLNEFDEENASKFYLIRTEFGLTGWFELPKDNWENNYIKDLYSKGD